jgi:hypothetical protein
METYRPEPTNPGVDSEWVLVPAEPSPADIGSQRSVRRGTFQVMAGLAAGAMILGGVIGGVAMSGVDSDDSPPDASAVASSATLADTTLPPPPSMLSPDDDGDDEVGDGED